jgi:hypothetical protein
MVSKVFWVITHKIEIFVKKSRESRTCGETYGELDSCALYASFVDLSR